MQNKNSETIHIKLDEGIISIINKLKRSEKDEITLVVPADALLLQSVVNLRILKKKAGELRKNVSIVKINENNNQEPDKKNKNEITDFISGEKIMKADRNKETCLKINNEDDSGDKSSEISIDKKADFKNNNQDKKTKIFDIVKKVKLEDNEEKEKLLENNIEDEDKKLNKARIVGGETRIKNKEKGEIEKRWAGEQDDKKVNQSKIIGIQKSKENYNLKKTKNRIALLPSISSKIFAVFIFICVATAVITAVFVFPKVDLILALQIQKADYDFEFAVEESIEEINVINNKIPAERIEVVNEKTETYTATGKKRLTEKAIGKVTVFNEYSSSPQKIVANTRILSKDGQLFRTQESITIPGFSRVEGKDVPGEVVVRVSADVPGEAYNIGATSFTLPGLQGHPKYSSVYARSTEAMAGGIDKDVIYFSESDYITAKDKLIKIMAEESEQDFLSKISEEVILLEKTKKEDSPEIKTSVKIGDIANEFQMTVSTKTSALVVNKNSLDDLIKEKINYELAKNMKIIEGGREYQIEEAIEDASGGIILPVSVTQDLVVKIEADEIKEEITGKDEAELNSYFNGRDEIKSANIKFWPFWVKSIPSSYDKINIEFAE